MFTGKQGIDYMRLKRSFTGLDRCINASQRAMVAE